jgi:hypothetical protein
MTPDALRLEAPPIADCSRYDALRRNDGTPEHSRSCRGR